MRQYILVNRTSSKFYISASSNTPVENYIKEIFKNKIFFVFFKNTKGRAKNGSEARHVVDTHCHSRNKTYTQH